MVRPATAPRLVPPIATFAASRMGVAKQENEDSYVVGSMTSEGAPATSSMLLIVADGMGGHGDGRTASAVAVDCVTRHLFEQLPQDVSASPQAVTAELERAFQAAKTRVEQVAQGEGVSRKMGTTLTMVLVYGAGFFVAHAGDSRCYRLRDRALMRLTKDHTLGAQLREQTEGTPAAALVDGRWDNALANAVGGGCLVLRVETHIADVVAGDRLLLCSDGLNVLDDDEIATLLGAEVLDEALPRALVDRAAAAGSRDDITALVAEVGPTSDIGAPSA